MELSIKDKSLFSIERVNVCHVYEVTKHSSSVNEQNHQLTHTMTVPGPETRILPIPRSKTLSWSLLQQARKCEK